MISISRRKLLMGSATLSLGTLLGGCNEKIKYIDQPQKGTVKIGILSDTHAYDPLLGNDIEGEYFQQAVASDRKAFLDSTTFLNTAIDRLIEQKVNIIIVPGDLTKDGEILNHNATREALQKARDQGIFVYVTTGNHDINNPYGYKKMDELYAKGSVYLEGNSFGADAGSVAPYMSNSTDERHHHDIENFDLFYANFGFNAESKLVEKDQNSYSFVAEPVEGLWILSIDTPNSSILNVHDYWDENNSEYGSTGGTLLAPERYSTLDWVKSIGERAQSEGKILIAFCHHGSIEHFAGKAAILGDYLIDGSQKSFTDGLSYQEYVQPYFNTYTKQHKYFTYNSPTEYISRTLAESGVNVVLTGHFHANDVAKREYDDGSWIVDIQTGSTVSYPAPYRIIELNMDEQRIDVSTNNNELMDSVTTTDLGALVDSMAENILTALGLELDSFMQDQLDKHLLKKPFLDTMLDWFENGDHDYFGYKGDVYTTEQVRELFLAFIQQDDASIVSLQCFEDLTIATLLSKVLKAHYHGDEDAFSDITNEEKYAMYWSQEYLDTNTKRTKNSNVNQRWHMILEQLNHVSQQQNRFLGSIIKPLIPTIYGLLSDIGEAILYSPAPDNEFSLDLKSGKLIKKQTSELV